MALLVSSLPLSLTTIFGFPFEQNMQAPVAETAAFMGDKPSCAGEGRHRPPGSSCISWSCGSSRWLYTPAVRSSRMRLADGRQLSASPRASPLLSQEVLQRRVVQHGISQQPLQPRVLVLQRPQPLGLGDVHPAELGLPFV